MHKHLGLKGTDILTGYVGVIMGRSEYYTGCTQLLLVPTALDKDGKRVDGEWFDESRVKIAAPGPRLGLLDVAKAKQQTRRRAPGADERAPSRSR